MSLWTGFIKGGPLSVATRERMLATNEDVCTSLEGEIKNKETQVADMSELLKQKELRIETLNGDIESLKAVGFLFLNSSHAHGYYFPVP